MNAFSLPPETATWISALQTDLRLWALALVCWLERLLPARWMRLIVQRSIREARQDVKLLIFAKMLMRLRRRDVGHRHQIAQPAAISAPPGFRLRRRTTRTLKLCTRGVRLRTLGDVRHVIETIDAVVTRALKRLPLTILTHALVAARIPARGMTSCAPAPVAEAADTS